MEFTNCKRMREKVGESIVNRSRHVELRLSAIKLTLNAVFVRDVTS